MFLQPIFTPLGFGSQLGQYGWVFAVAAATGLIAKENVIATFGTLAACLGTGIIASESGVLEVSAIVNAIALDIGCTPADLMPTLMAFVVFNMATIPCFATVATARAELGKGKNTNLTLVFWLVTSFVTATITYLVCLWWWTAFIFLATGILVGVSIKAYNKKHPLR